MADLVNCLLDKFIDSTTISNLITTSSMIDSMRHSHVVNMTMVDPLKITWNSTEHLED